MAPVIVPVIPSAGRYKRLGDVTSGSRTISTDYTPHSIGSSDGGTGTASFTTTATDESDFTFGRRIDVTTPVSDSTGLINSLSLGSGLVTVGSDTILARLNATASLGPVYAGDMVYRYSNPVVIAGGNTYSSFQLIGTLACWSNTATDISSGVTGRVFLFAGGIGSGAGKFSGNGGQSYATTAGQVIHMIDIGNSKVINFHSYDGSFISEFSISSLVHPSFITMDNQGNLYIGDNGSDISHAKRITKYDSTYTQVAQWSYTQNFTGIAGSDWYAADSTFICAIDSGNVYRISTGDGSILQTGTIPTNTIRNPVISIFDRSLFLTGEALTPTKLGSGGNIMLQYSVSSMLEVDRWGFPKAGADDGYTSVIAGISIGSSFMDYPTPGTILWVSEIEYSSGGSIAGSVVTGYIVNTGGSVYLSGAYLRYISSVAPSPFGFEFFAEDRPVAYPGWTGNVWDYVKQLASATNTQLFASGSKFTVYPSQGYNVFEIEQFVSGSNANISASVSALSRKIQVVSQNSEYVYIRDDGTGNQTGDTVVYDAFEDNNNIVSIDVGQASIVKVSTPHWLKGVDNPTPGVQYTVQDSNGVVVDPAVFSNAGGGIRASVDADGQSINLSVTGPIYPIPGNTGPYSFTQNANRTAMLQITGWGVKVAPQAMVLYTGADPDFISQDMGETINNPFIQNVSDAYDRGAWATFDSSGPAISLTFTVPQASFKWSSGDRVSYRDQLWRVLSYSVSSGQVSITAVPYTTVDDAQKIWRGSTVDQYDSFWRGDGHAEFDGYYRVYDKKIRPLWNPLSIGPATQVVLYLDTDSVPFWYEGDFGTAVQWISIDTDGVPYFSVTRDSYRTWLDIDGQPYYGIG